MKRTTLCLPFVLLATLACLQSATAAEKPNIVFLLVDDLAYADCGFNGGKEIKTPNIDQLAKGGTVIESHYVQPVCSPTRSTLMTGRYPTKTGVYTIVRPKAKWGLPLSERTLANALKDAGYETAITGKWHLGEFDRAYLPTSRGFDHQYGHYFGALDYFTHVRDGSHDWYKDDQELKEKGYSTHLIAREACRLIANKDKSKPLFLYVPFNGVHSPFQVPDNYLAPYAKLQGNRQKLAGMLAAVDEAIGQIVSAIEAAGLHKNTLFIFSSDNGGPKPGDNGSLRGFKGSIFEGGVRGCAFATWPGQLPAGKRIQEPMHMVDWYPTLVQLAGGSLDQETTLDGKNVWPMLTQGAPSPHDAILCVRSHDRAAVRMGEWKLLMNANENRVAGAEKTKNRKGESKSTSEEFLLYNLAKDVGETTNLIDQEPERAKSMRSKLAQLLQDAVPPGAQP